MGDLDRSAIYGGVYSKAQEKENTHNCDASLTHNYKNIAARLENSLEYLGISREKTKKLLEIFIYKLKKHAFNKQDIYLPIAIALILLALVFASRTAYSKTPESTNNLPVEDNYNVKLIGTKLSSDDLKICSASDPGPADKSAKARRDADTDLKNAVEKIVESTPMAAMIDSISEKPRPVAAFIVGIAMKESKFGIYSPKLAGQDCYNYWGYKGGGKTVAGGYTCFSSPEEAVEAVGQRIEKMVAKGVQTPAQAISWKCGSSCAGHDPAGVRKWISDVAVNYYKLVNS